MRNWPFLISLCCIVLHQAFGTDRDGLASVVENQRYIFVQLVHALGSNGCGDLGCVNAFEWRVTPDLHRAYDLLFLVAMPADLGNDWRSDVMALQTAYDSRTPLGHDEPVQQAVLEFPAASLS